MTAPTSLTDWGWDPAWADALAAVGPELIAGRVVEQARDRWTVVTAAGAGPARRVSANRAEAPVVGDWVALAPGPMPSDPWSLVEVLPRRSAFTRGAVDGAGPDQVLAANVDRAWIVHGLDHPPNPRRLERYLALAWESGAVPEVVLTKADLAADLPAVEAQVSAIAIGVTVAAVSAHDPASVARLVARLEPGRTVALLGPSGAGKSTLVNLLAEREIARTGAVRESDAKGRHTTTTRELYQLPGGALLLDTPGLRELRLGDATEGIGLAFPEIEALAEACRFRDCAQQSEPGCAVQAAVAAGRLDPERLAGFQKLRAEVAAEVRRTDPLARARAMSEFKAAVKTLKRHHPKYGDQA